MTIADLDAMPDDDNRYELIEGELFVSRAPGLNHQHISDNLVVIFRAYLDRHPIGKVVSAPGVIFTEISAVIPDLVFMSHESRDRIAVADRIRGAPDLIIEILSPGPENYRRDRIVKSQLYARQGVREYWLVDPENHQVEVYALKDEELVPAATYGVSDELRSDLLPGFNCRVDLIFRV
jgi:Uma2 family endonuclease